MNDLRPYRRIVSGESGWWFAPIRGLLRVGEWCYAGAVSRRNRFFDQGGVIVRLPVPVISVGNLTVGGTGKTPLVMELVSRLEQRKGNPAVVSRGYGSKDGEPNDEEILIRSRCPGVICVSNPDRVQAGRTACERFAANVIVLDDGFQHRRLHRDLDIVLIDATCPFGYDHLLPRGLLREPVSSLRRADAILITRCDQASAARLADISRRLHQTTHRACVLRCRTRVIDLVTLDGAPWRGSLAGARVAALAAIGNPSAFACTIQSLGANVVQARWFPDHHQYRSRDIRRWLSPSQTPAHDLVVTTEKDAVKLRQVDGLRLDAFVVVRIAMEFMDHGEVELMSLMDRVLGQYSSSRSAALSIPTATAGERNL